jgi:hypothetical protein
MSYFNLTIKLAIFYTEEEERRHRTQSFYLIIQNLPTTISFFLNVCLSDGLLVRNKPIYSMQDTHDQVVVSLLRNMAR